MAIKGNGKNNYKCNYTERKQYSINGWKEKTLGQVVVVVGCFLPCISLLRWQKLAEGLM